ncbi:nucleotide-binding alpha-beta plait domain-containing protein [Tanacetum coccineum]
MGERSKEDEVSKRALDEKKSTQTNSNREIRSNTGVDPKNRGVKGYSISYVNVVKGSQSLNTEMESKPALVLDSTCVNQRDYSNFLMGKVKDIASLTNLKVVLGKEGFENIELKYMGGYWIMLKFQSKEAKQMFQSSVGIGTWFSQLQQASTDFIIDGRVTWMDIEGIPLNMWLENTFKRIASIWGMLIHVEDQEEVRAKEISGWVPDFVEENEEEIDTEDEINGEEFIVVPDSKFEEEIPKTKDQDVSVRQEEANSEDPFKIYDLLNKKEDVNNKNANEENSLKFPPGFTPNDTKVATEEESDSGAKKYRAKEKTKEDVAESMCSGHFQKAGMPRGVWMLNGKNLLIISVYAPQELNEKKMLWDYLSSVTENWNGEVVIIGDFNEVRKKAKRFGSMFKVQGANAFNMFISNAGLEEVHLGGCSFTWCHKSATKMSKLDRFLISESLMSSCPNISAVSLDRYLSDHRPILMRESHYDYGPV